MTKPKTNILYSSSNIAPKQKIKEMGKDLLPDFDHQHPSTLLKIHRNYSRDEAIKVLEAQIKSLEKENAFLKTESLKDLTVKALSYEIGVLKSENAELKDNFDRKPAILKNIEEYSEDMKKVVAFYTKQTAAMKKATKRAIKTAAEWRDNYLSLRALK